jgi:hypothetical protein
LFPSKPFNKINSFPNFLVPISKKEERNMMKKNSWLLVILAVISLTACATMQSGVKEPPLPNDINIIPPSPDLPKEISAFSGKWMGIWSYGTNSILVVEEIQDTWAQVVYSIGDLPTYNVSAKYWRVKCKVIPGPKPKLECPALQPVSGGYFFGELLIFEMKDSNTLEGVQEFRGGGGTTLNTVTMKRAD